MQPWRLYLGRCAENTPKKRCASPDLDEIGWYRRQPATCMMTEETRFQAEGDKTRKSGPTQGRIQVGQLKIAKDPSPMGS